MEKVLYTIDELSGLINAACLMRPSRSVLDIEVKSVKKKYKSHGFAAGVNRDVIEKGCEMLGMPLDEVIAETIEGMRECAEAIGLKGDILKHSQISSCNILKIFRTWILHYKQISSQIPFQLNNKLVLKPQHKIKTFSNSEMIFHTVIYPIYIISFKGFSSEKITCIKSAIKKYQFIIK